MVTERHIESEQRRRLPIVPSVLPNPFLDLERRALQLDGKTHEQGTKIVSSEKTDHYTLTAADDLILCDCTAKDITITVPAASGFGGKRWLIKKVDSTRHVIYVKRSSDDLIDGEKEWIIDFQYNCMWLVSDETSYHLI